MKTTKNFAAQQLSKKQMNEVKGGKEFYCGYFSSAGVLINSFPVEAPNKETAIEITHTLAPMLTVECI